MGKNKSRNDLKNTLVHQVKSLQEEEEEETQTYKSADAPNLPPHSRDLAQSFLFYWKPSFCYTMEPQMQSLTMPVCLEDVRIKGIPQSAFYISDFISAEEEQVLLNKIETAIADMAFRSQQEQYPPRKPTARMAYKACDYTSSLMPRVGGRASDPYLLQQSA